MKKFIHFVIFSMLLLVSMPGLAKTIDQMIVFGDSLSDNGNFYSFSMHIVPKNPPYFAGHFSNGITWIEHVADHLHLNRENPEQFLDLAYGGATARADNNDIAWQIKTYLKKYPQDERAADHLFVLWVGGNDYLPGKGSSDVLTTETIAAIQKHLETLIQHGAKHILTLNLPNLGQTPLAKLAGPHYAEKITRMIQLHNAKLVMMLSKLRLQNPEVEFIFFDVTSSFKDALDHPQKFGIKQTQEPCFKGDTFMYSALNDPVYDRLKERFYQADRVVYCAKADEYFFWDHVHPTRVVHEMIAEKVLAKLKKIGYV